MRGNGFAKISEWAPFMLIGDDVTFDFGNKGKWKNFTLAWEWTTQLNLHALIFSFETELAYIKKDLLLGLSLSFFVFQEVKIPLRAPGRPQASNDLTNVLQV